MDTRPSIARRERKARARHPFFPSPDNEKILRPCLKSMRQEWGEKKKPGVNHGSIYPLLVLKGG